MQFPKLRSFTIASIILFSIAIIQIVWNWSLLPDEIPTHYNALGQPDRFGHKAFIFVPPLLGFIVWGVLHFIALFSIVPPSQLHMDTKKEKQIHNTQMMLQVIGNEVLLILTMFSFKEVYTAKGGRFSLGVLEMLFVIFVFVGTILYFTHRNSQLKNNDL